MKKILTLITISILATGCSTTHDSQIVDELTASPEQVASTKEEPITIDENGLITDDVAIITISEKSYLDEMDNILTEDGYSMRITSASELDKNEVISNNTIYFNFDSSKISSEMQNTISKQIEFLKKYPKIKVILEGHTDERGSNAYNVVLGEKRANAIKEILVKSGIKKDQIEVISYGEMKPISNESSEEGWKKNRRAVFIYK